MVETAELSFAAPPAAAALCCAVPEAAAADTALAPAAVETRALGVTHAGRPLLRGIDLRVEDRRVLALVGPSGAGKTTLLSCLNRMIELAPGIRQEGEVFLFGESIARRDADAVRREVGMLFQQPVIFPGSIADNVLFGLRHAGIAPRASFPERLERALGEAALWDEVKDRLREPAASLSVGQQQRLCLARALAVEPRVLLLDEPTSALDPRSTEAIEERIREIAKSRAIVLVTHSLGQARRVADQLACLDRRDGPGGPAGELFECGPCRERLDRPQSRELARFLESERA
ncbi:MAG TPA: ATP-binding cassette domain-containing protein [Thermoanaerobaculia bacterium]|nr:ATP-binding cassette domain-containing protein [Thermoanaerobaculia bacterium]